MLIIQRKTAWFAKMSHLKIILNGSRIGNIEEGEIKSFEMKKGSYILQIKGLFVHSQLVKLEVENDENMVFVVNAFGRGYWKTFLNLKRI